MAAIPVKRPDLDALTNSDVTTTLLLAFARARVEPFTGMDWAAFAGATAPAYMVHLHSTDLEELLGQLCLGWWPASQVTMVLDANGLTLMLSSPVNCCGWHVDLAVRPQPGGDPGTPEEYWQPNDTVDGLWKLTLDQLSPESRALVLACPPSAQPYVLKGYLAAQALDATPKPYTHWLYEEDKSKWVLRRRNADGTAGPVECRSDNRLHLERHAQNSGFNPEHARTPLKAFAT